MTVTINGEIHDVPAGLTVQELMHHLNLKDERIAVERNREIVRRADWATTLLREGDQLEIVHFVGGGARSLSSQRSQKKNSKVED